MQLHHVGQALSLAKVWIQLKTLHQPTGYCTALMYMCTLYHIEASEEENIPDFINKIKKLVNEINSMRTPFKIDNATYGGILTQVLPPSWEQFINNLFERDAASDKCLPINIVHFQHIIKNEYYRKMEYHDPKNTTQYTGSKKKPLANRLSNRTGKTLICKNCKKKSYATDDCCHLSKPLYATCNHFGHATSKCWRNKPNKQRSTDLSTFNGDQCLSKKQKVKYSNAAKEEEEECAMYIEKLVQDDNQKTEVERAISPLPDNEDNFNFYEASDIDNYVQYYSKDMQKFLTSQNYRFLDSTNILPPITSGNDHPCKGEEDHETVSETVSNTSTQEIPIT